MYNKKDLLKTKVKDLKIKKGMKVKELIEGMRQIGGFSGQNLVHGIDIIEMMMKDRDSYNFLSFPADIISTGTRGVISSMVKYFDALMTTCGTMDHDIARAFGGKYSIGSFSAN
ncbi:MAG: deoxyhypusine synthase family protein, partial [Candidatus Micrarchaeota archaeon]|nr:deoxyhypusine synthase family protein [Candidatus Micrarchaeota archaeon]